MASTIIATTGVPGCGKSYVRCARFLVDDFLLNTGGVHYSNFPVNIDAVSEAVVRKSNFLKTGFWAKITAPFRLKKHIVTVEEIRKRIVVIPKDILQAWRREESGPWEYFQGVDLRYAHIAIDEIHNFIPATGSSTEHINRWTDFLAEVRHRGCTFEGLTQDHTQVHECLIKRAGLRYELIPAEDLRDPFFHIQMMDWYNLKAGFTGDFHKTVFEKEFQLRSSRWKCLRTRRFLIVPEYFKYYNSFNASLQEEAAGGVDDNRAPLFEYQKRTKLSLVTWFVLKNFFSLFWRFSVGIFFFWLTFGGGMNHCIQYFLTMNQSIAKANTSAKKKDSVKKVEQAETLYSEIYFGKDLSKLEAGQGVIFTLDEVKKMHAEKQKTESDLTGLQKHSQEIEAELAKLKAQIMSGFVPVFFTENEVVLKNGLRIHKNYKFIEGDYEKLTVKFICLPERYYQLSDDRIIRM